MNRLTYYDICAIREQERRRKRFQRLIARRLLCEQPRRIPPPDAGEPDGAAASLPIPAGRAVFSFVADLLGTAAFFLWISSLYLLTP